MNKYGVLLNVEHRVGVTPLSTDEENEEYASESITRHKSGIKFQPKIGHVIYAFGRYGKVCRATVPVNEDFYMLLMFNKGQDSAYDFNRVIMSKVIPLVSKERNNFVT